VAVYSRQSSDAHWPSRPGVAATPGQVRLDRVHSLVEPVVQPALVEGRGFDDHVVPDVEDTAVIPAAGQAMRGGDGEVEGLLPVLVSGTDDQVDEERERVGSADTVHGSGSNSTRLTRP
jgi:hypothetical protein